MLLHFCLPGVHITFLAEPKNCKYGRVRCEKCECLRKKCQQENMCDFKCLTRTNGNLQNQGKGFQGYLQKGDSKLTERRKYGWKRSENFGLPKQKCEQGKMWDFNFLTPEWRNSNLQNQSKKKFLGLFSVGL